MESFAENYKKEFEKILTHLKEDLSILRIGRANPALVENILVETYGAKTPLKQLASVTAPAVRSILIQPWDKSITKDIEKAIVAVGIGLNPVNEGQQIRLTVPQLTEESRKELVKTVGEKMEKARIALRQIRDKIKEEITKKERSGEASEDDRYNLIKKLDESVKDYNEQIKEIGKRKEAEIMQI